jgi:phosphate transport system permease protein
MSRLARRKFVNNLAKVVALLLTLTAVYPLFSVLWKVVERGLPAISIEFLFALPTAPSLPGGGIFHALVGSGIVVGLAAAMGGPFGLLAGIFLAEFRETWFSRVVRTTADVMTGIPSIVAGLFGYAVIVTRYGFSGWAAAVALALIFVPIVTRTTEEALRTVPQTYREAGLALGAPRWYTILFVVLRPAWGSIATGVLLGISRIAGESAPLLLTMLTSFFLVTNPGEPMAAMPYLIYDYNKNAIPKLQDQSWGIALVLITLVLAINILVRLVSRRRAAA